MIPVRTTLLRKRRRAGPAARAGRRGSVRGFTMVELLVAMTLGLFVIGGVATAYVQNQRTRAELERNSRQLENGRYAVQLLADELRHAGYLGAFDPRALPDPAALPALCEASAAGLRTALPVSIQGADDAAAAPACVTDLKTGTDIVVIRRASTCVAGAAGCAALAAGHPHLQPSLCDDPTELGSPTIGNRFDFSSALADLGRRDRDCAASAPAHRFLVRVYYIANNNVAGDGIPTLKRAELNGGAFAVEPLVEGIENLQIEYGIDTDGNGAPEQYGTDPAAFGGCAAAACQVGNWLDVTAVKLHLLARNVEPSPGHSDAKTYVLGLDGAGADKEVGPFGDAFRRHAYSTVVRLNNVAGRRE